jgi:hypothetical protein
MQQDLKQFSCNWAGIFGSGLKIGSGEVTFEADSVPRLNVVALPVCQFKASKQAQAAAIENAVLVLGSFILTTSVHNQIYFTMKTVAIPFSNGYHFHSAARQNFSEVLIGRFLLRLAVRCNRK